MRVILSSVGLLWVFDQDRIGTTIEQHGVWDGHLLPHLDRAESGAAIDIGAHVGFFTRYLAARHHTVIAVEPVPVTRELLRLNCDLRANTLSHVLILGAAAYSERTRLGLVQEWLPVWGLTEDLDLDTTVSAGCLTFLPEWRETPLSVPAVPLDDLLPLLLEADQPVTLIKVDAQGCDLRALQGLRETIARDRPLIVFEYEPEVAVRLGETWDDYLHFFRALDYQVAPIALTDYVAEPR